MRKMISKKIFIPLLLVAFAWSSAYGWSWSNPWLVKINGVKYTKNDFVHWWENWREKDTPLPETLKPFIDWFLLFQEGERMRLFEDPSYRKKVRVFLEVRALMILKREEVDKKIKVTTREIKKIYKERYVPLLHVRAVVFPKEKEASAFLEKAKKGESFDELVKRTFPKNNRRAFDWGWRRPFVFPASVRESLIKMEEGKVIGPVEWMGKFWLLELVEKKKGSDKDFNKVKGRIEEKLRKEQEGRLTLALIERLKKKYHVWVDYKLLKSIDIDNPQKEYMDKPLLRMGKVEMKVKDFLIQVKREIDFRKKYKFSIKDKEKIKRMVMGNLISQTLTTWEALSRHYERKPPFKWVYRFYCQHRIIKELENQLFWPKVKVSEDDAKKYYQEHLSEYKLPGLVKVAIIQTGDEKLVEKLEKALNRGEDFFEVAKKLTFHGAIVQRVPVTHMAPEMQKVVSRLSLGEVSAPVKVGKYTYIVKLIDRVAERQRPFEEVKKSILDILKKERFEKVKGSYLSELRKRSKIEVNEAAWQRVREELGRKDEAGKKTG